MTITTEEVENLARMWDWWEAGQAADALRSLAAERDALQAKAFRVAVAYEALKAENEKLRRLVSYLAGTNTDHVRVAVAGNPTVCDAIVAEARAVLGEKE